MDWLRRTGRVPPQEEEAAPEEGFPAPTERAAPGVSALFSGLKEDGSHTVLDFGAAAETTLHLYSRFARRIRFADLLTDPPHGKAWAADIAGSATIPRSSLRPCAGLEPSGPPCPELSARPWWSG